MKKKVNILEATTKIEKDHVSRDDLRSMAVGQSIEFVVPDGKLESARSTCNNMKYERKRFSARINLGEVSSITVTRIE